MRKRVQMLAWQSSSTVNSLRLVIGLTDYPQRVQLIRTYMTMSSRPIIFIFNCNKIHWIPRYVVSRIIFGWVTQHNQVTFGIFSFSMLISVFCFLPMYILDKIHRTMQTATAILCIYIPTRKMTSIECKRDRWKVRRKKRKSVVLRR